MLLPTVHPSLMDIILTYVLNNIRKNRRVDGISVWPNARHVRDVNASIRHLSLKLIGLRDPKFSYYLLNKRFVRDKLCHYVNFLIMRIICHQSGVEFNFASFNVVGNEWWIRMDCKYVDWIRFRYGLNACQDTVQCGTRRSDAVANDITFDGPPNHCKMLCIFIKHVVMNAIKVYACRMTGKLISVLERLFTPILEFSQQPQARLELECGLPLYFFQIVCYSFLCQRNTIAVNFLEVCRLRGVVRKWENSNKRPSGPNVINLSTWQSPVTASYTVIFLSQNATFRLEAKHKFV